MPSPFPGMNPYIEVIWHDFHERFIPAAATYLVPQVRSRYIVSIDENVYLHDVPNREYHRLGRPDLAVIQDDGTSIRNSGVGVREAPLQVLLPEQDSEGLSYLNIMDRESREVVTVIELLSPANKRLGENRAQYLAKRSAVCRSGANFVEIDLLRAGPPMPANGRPDCTYAVLVSRVDRRPSADFRPFGLRNSLPAIPVPLRLGETDASLDLRAILDRVYDESGYADYIYRRQPDPPLDAVDLGWARALVPVT